MIRTLFLLTVVTLTVLVVTACFFGWAASGEPPAPTTPEAVSTEPAGESRPATPASRSAVTRPASEAHAPGIPSRPASRRADRLAVSRPAYPSPELVRRTGIASQALRRRLDGSFRVVEAPPFVVAGNMSGRELKRYVHGSIVPAARAMWASHFDVKCDKVITVLLLADGQSYSMWAKKLFGDTDVPYFGYYRHVDRTLVMNIHTGTGTLVHELTHALIDFDWPAVPVWFNEGLASLHEQCRLEDKGIVGLANWRLRGLQEDIRRGRLPSLGVLTRTEDFYGARRGANYAHARYFCMYLQRRGLLGRFYKRYRAAHARGTPAVEVIEAVSGRRIEQIDKDLQQWVMTLKWD